LWLGTYNVRVLRHAGNSTKVRELHLSTDGSGAISGPEHLIESGLSSQDPMVNHLANNKKAPEGAFCVGRIVIQWISPGSPSFGMTGLEPETSAVTVCYQPEKSWRIDWCPIFTCLELAPEWFPVETTAKSACTVHDVRPHQSVSARTFVEWFTSTVFTSLHSSIPLELTHVEV
jgi:hypothetical protein